MESGTIVKLGKAWGVIAENSKNNMARVIPCIMLEDPNTEEDVMALMPWMVFTSRINSLTIIKDVDRDIFKIFKTPEDLLEHFDGTEEELEKIENNILENVERDSVGVLAECSW